MPKDGLPSFFFLFLLRSRLWFCGSAADTGTELCLVRHGPRNGGVAKRWHSTRGFREVHAASEPGHSCLGHMYWSRLLFSVVAEGLGPLGVGPRSLVLSPASLDTL